MKKHFACLLVSVLLLGVFTPLEAVENNSGIKAAVSKNIKKKNPVIDFNYDFEAVDKIKYKNKLAADKAEYKKITKGYSAENKKLYLITEKILRANRLNERSWRIVIKNNAENVNAYATAANLVVIISALYDSLYYNDDALAFVISHEIAHFLYNHHQKTLEDYRKYRYYKDGKEYMLFPYYKNERKREKEADTEALTIMTRAGYDPYKALDAMEFFDLLPELYNSYSSHPKIEDRITNINTEISYLDVNYLNNQGKYNIYNSEVLDLKKSTDKKTLVLTDKSKGQKSKYTPEPPDEKLVRKAYFHYKNNDFKNAANLFEKAYKFNKKNYLPPLFLSYINEYEFNLNKNKRNLKAARKWIKRALKYNSEDINVKKQYNDIEKIYSELKPAKKRAKNDIDK